MNSERDTPFNDFEKIEAYLLGTMNETERVRFDQERRTNREFDKLVSAQEELLRSVEIGAMRDQLKNIHKRQVANNTQKPRFWLAIAAGFAILISVIFWWQLQPNQYGQLFASHVTVDPGLPVPMSATENGSYHFYDAMVDYKLENYGLAFSKWQTLSQTDPNNDTLLFYMGSARFNQGLYKESSTLFTEVVNDQNSIFRFKSQWYMLLSALAQEDETSVLAIEALPDSPYTDQINAIQAELKN